MINLTDKLDKTYNPLRFKASSNKIGYCYLRVQIVNGKVVFTCAQLLNYNKVSISESFTDIRISAINALILDNILKVSCKKRFSDLFKSKQSKKNKFNRLVINYFNMNSVWVEYFPFEKEISSKYIQGIYLKKNGYKVLWFNTSENLLKKEHPEFDFEVDDRLLKNWDISKLTKDNIRIYLEQKYWTMKNINEHWDFSETWMGKHRNNNIFELVEKITY